MIFSGFVDHHYCGFFPFCGKVTESEARIKYFGDVLYDFA